LEFFAMNDPFQASRAEVASPLPPIATDDPMQYARPSIAASLPTRPKTEELDLDLGILGRDEDN
jgi:hypothetical protein